LDCQRRPPIDWVSVQLAREQEDYFFEEMSEFLQKVGRKMERANSGNISDISDARRVIHDHGLPSSNEMLLSAIAIALVSARMSTKVWIFEGILIIAKSSSSENLFKRNSRNSRNKSISFAEHVYKIIPQLRARNLANCQTANREMTLFSTHAQKIGTSLRMLDTSKDALSIIRVLVNL
jgi:hypothetical protein